MIKKRIFNNLRKIQAITLKEVKLQMRFKSGYILMLLTPIITIIMPLIIMDTFFDYNIELGIWNENNFLVFTFIAYNVYLLKGSMEIYPNSIRDEKFWQTLPALIIAPFSRYILLIGFFLSQLIHIMIPFVVFLILCFVYYPIQLFTLFFVLIVFFLISLIFSSIGLLLSVFIISNENIFRLFQFLTNIVFWLSCITYPFQIFPDYVQEIIKLNPFYYVFDFLRLIWIEDNIILTINSHLTNAIILFGCGVIFPILGVEIFNFIYKKYGIVGY